MHWIITYHPVHKPYEAPESNGIILHDCVYGCKQVTHTLYVAEIFVVLVVCEEHILHLFEMDIGADISEG